MIRARELRIGNKSIWGDYPDGVWEYCTIGHKDITHLVEMSDEHNHYHGIPITEDWLIKLGADKYDYGKNEDLIDYKFYLGKCIILLRFIKSKNMYYVRHLSTKFKYIHHLQNYVFVTTGEELNVKE